MPTKRRPKRGSRAFWPRKRAKRIYPRIKKWPVSNDAKPLGFAGYKVGMTHFMMIDTNPNIKTKGMEIFKPVTVIECPPLTVFGYRIYDGSYCVSDIISDKFDKNMKRKIKVPKKKQEQKDVKGDRICLLVNTNPTFKKTPEIFEIALGGSYDDQLKYAQEVLGKQIKMSDIFKEGEYLDSVSVTKGKGFEGPVKRFGVKLQSRKTEQIHRKTGALGQKEPGKVRYTIPREGQLGFHTRTELNKRILKFIDAKDIIPKGGFVNSYAPKSECVLIEGSIPGPKKRLIRFRQALRPPKQRYPVDIKYISLESQQGR